ncbi:FAD binding domain protein [uncultured Desulfobacterium sp.]|uniref:FAD binding domain protein n=1 Tax=uncultured Desulfobacterium sp. TaxID=201089 RepID=A0A445MTS0_9BACT|nr:FAD binding domain protein [uncultured Desulfobacterium sp.]
MSIKNKLTDLLGNRVSDAPAALDAYRTDYSLASPGTPLCVAYPNDSKEIMAIVALANETNTPVVPVSSRVHFTGAAIPKQGGVIVDMKNMNKIWNLDERNRKITVEPGVTWNQLYPVLAEKNLMVCPPMLPHGEQSVITTFLERSPLVIPLYEYAEPLLSMEVVWPNGTLFRTGSASAPTFPNSFAEGVNPEGPGTMDFYRLLQGAQGTMGIVTWAIIKTEYLSPMNKFFFFSFNNIEDAIKPTYSFLRRKIGYDCFIMNRLDLALICAEEYPNEFDVMMKKLPEWMIVLALRASRRRPEEKIQYETNAINDICRKFNGMQYLNSLPGSGHAAIRLTEILRQPWTDKGPYWKHRLTGNCQDLMFITKMSMVPEFVSMMTKAAVAESFPVANIGTYIQPIEGGRACHVEFNMYYDPKCDNDKAKVLRLHDRAAKAMLPHGAQFTRPYGSLSDMVYERAASYTATLKRVKKIFDENNIMNPGNLCF